MEEGFVDADVEAEADGEMELGMGELRFMRGKQIEGIDWNGLTLSALGLGHDIQLEEQDRSIIGLFL
jgi:hypothetical protein